MCLLRTKYDVRSSNDIDGDVRTTTTAATPIKLRYYVVRVIVHGRDTEIVATNTMTMRETSKPEYRLGIVRKRISLGAFDDIERVYCFCDM